MANPITRTWRRTFSPAIKPFTVDGPDAVQRLKEEMIRRINDRHKLPRSTDPRYRVTWRGFKAKNLTPKELEEVRKESVGEKSASYARLVDRYIRALQPVPGATDVLQLNLTGVKPAFAVIHVSYSPNKASLLRVNFV